MKNKIMFLVIVLVSLITTSCKDKQTMEQCLTTNSERKKLMVAVANNNALATEMIQIMMTNDNCKNLVRDNIIQDSTLINSLLVMIAKDTSMSKMMMIKSIEMCDGDPSKCNLLMGTMQMYPSTLLYVNDKSRADIKLKK